MSVFDVSKLILHLAGPMSAMKLQKLVYYGQAWHLVWHDAPLFDARVEAWANGPVVPVLYHVHRGRFTLTADDIVGDPGNLTSDQIGTIETVLGFYGAKSAQWLSHLTHVEAPWRNARAGMDHDHRASQEITQTAMADYYGGL
ncbi:Panacea domain-containing protein [Ruegeria jejuensis]|uniref:Panacea domain-containing protein n=1 Tax=Ruegeria jejuensis TaxID=3233338 RepID=UPI00355AFAB6